MAIRLQRVYDSPLPSKGKRVLVDRVWPRAISKEQLQLDLWVRELAPSTALRKWFGHDPERWEEFRRRYRAELRQPSKQALLRELKAMALREQVTLLYGARDKAHNQAVVLRDLLKP